MRVALSLPRKTWGGASTTVADLGTGLLARGHDVLLLCKPGSALHRWAEGRIPVAPVLHGADFPLPAILRARTVLRRHRSQVLLSVLPSDLRMTATAARLLDIPVVTHRLAATPIGGGPLARWMWRSIPCHIVANSQATRTAVIRSLGADVAPRVSVIYNGVDTGRFATAEPADLELPPGAVAVGYVGRLEREKGVLELAAAWPAVAARSPEAHLVVVGDGGARDEMRSALQGQPRVRWLGYRQDVPRLMRAMDLLVVPSRTEAFGLSAAEAMAAGVPVVATAVDGLPEVVDDGATGRLVPERNPAALARGIIELVLDPALRTRLGRRGAEIVPRRFGIVRLLDGYEAVFHAALERDGR